MIGISLSASSHRTVPRLAVAALLALAAQAACGGPAEREPGPAAEGTTSGGPAPAPAPGQAEGTAGAPRPAGGASGYAASPVAGGGRVTGRVLYRGTPPVAAPIVVTKDQAVCGQVRHTSESLVVGGGGGLRNVVVSLGPLARGKPFPAGPKPSLDQKGCRYIPHILIVPAGGEVDILNSDGILHNIHTFPKDGQGFNMAQPKFRKVMTHTFERPGTLRVGCDVHGWMSAWIIVVPHPYYAVTGDDGSFDLADVPPGTYTLDAWHETLGAREQTIRVAPGGTAETTLTFGG